MLNSFALEGMSFNQIKNLIEREVSLGRWMILTFHGIDGEWLSVDAAQFEKLLRFLDNQRTRIWTAPIYKIAKHIEDRRQTEQPRPKQRSSRQLP